MGGNEKEGIILKKEYDFSNARKNPYMKSIKQQSFFSMENILREAGAAPVTLNQKSERMKELGRD